MCFCRWEVVSLLPLVGAGVGTLNCRKCDARCNSKGYRSAMKGSTACEVRRKVASSHVTKFWNRISRSHTFNVFKRGYSRARGRV